MDSFPLGKGYSSKLGELEIAVEVRGKGWRYRIQQDGKEIAHHVPCRLWNRNHTVQSAKVEAVGKALELLGWQADAVAVSNALEWKSYGPGHEEE